MVYNLYVESGPRHKTTMVHVLDLLGCIARGPTTEEALEATPQAIYSFLSFLKQHGEAVDPEEIPTLRIAEHVTQGPWIGYGDPAPGFKPDFEPLAAEHLKIYLQRLGWMQAEMLNLIGGLSPQQLMAEPPDGHRPLFRILEHVAESGAAYLRYTVGRVEGLNEALKAVQTGLQALPGALERLWQLISARFQAMSDEERSILVPHGQVTWSARRGLRRTLEHTWEHLLEVKERVE